MSLWENKKDTSLEKLSEYGVLDATSTSSNTKKVTEKSLWEEDDIHFDANILFDNALVIEKAEKVRNDV